MGLHLSCVAEECFAKLEGEWNLAFLLPFSQERHQHVVQIAVRDVEVQSFADSASCVQQREH